MAPELTMVTTKLTRKVVSFKPPSNLEVDVRCKKSGNMTLNPVVCYRDGDDRPKILSSRYGKKEYGKAARPIISLKNLLDYPPVKAAILTYQASRLKELTAIELAELYDYVGDKPDAQHKTLREKILAFWIACEDFEIYCQSVITPCLANIEKEENVLFKDALMRKATFRLQGHSFFSPRTNTQQKSSMADYLKDLLTHKRFEKAYDVFSALQAFKEGGATEKNVARLSNAVEKNRLNPCSLLNTRGQYLLGALGNLVR